MASSSIAVTSFVPTISIPDFTSSFGIMPRERR
nr:MAG TPA: hypothetical protein [Caudoviricetes sp.]